MRCFPTAAEANDKGGGAHPQVLKIPLLLLPCPRPGWLRRAEARSRWGRRERKRASEGKGKEGKLKRRGDSPFSG